MQMEVIEIRNQLLQSSSYLIGNYLIDCGDGEEIVKEARSCNMEIKGIFLTHCHQDHIYGLPIVMEAFPNAKIYCSHQTHVGLNDDELNLKYILPEHAFKFIYNDNVVELSEGLHQIDELDIEMMLCNGHSNDCQSWIIDGNLFTGDAHIPFARVFTKWPSSNKAESLASEKKLLAIASERNLKIRPGHWQ